MHIRVHLAKAIILRKNVKKFEPTVKMGQQKKVSWQKNTTVQCTYSLDSSANNELVGIQNHGINTKRRMFLA